MLDVLPLALDDRFNRTLSWNKSMRSKADGFVFSAVLLARPRTHQIKSYPGKIIK